ncbi:probable E3 ubiquitin-protein ligase LOG2 [Solenopsis invicta]|uniref:probable E3 ubiquitin-protein ligase LOG2 n=1 Tax=Solenopsis invicta TaxID=13686 RepID=UPI00193CE988|nr:probable E3 ubiquitin-protein ligase LOG2 [Solenopsis invicta]
MFNKICLLDRLPLQQFLYMFRAFNKQYLHQTEKENFKDSTENENKYSSEEEKLDEIRDEDIYGIPSDDYGDIFSDESNENINIPYHPVQQFNDIRTPDCCCICLVEKADHIFVSCGHLCCCSDCILKLQSKKCPICNTNYTSYLKVRIP